MVEGQSLPVVKPALLLGHKVRVPTKTSLSEFFLEMTREQGAHWLEPQVVSAVQPCPNRHCLGPVVTLLGNAVVTQLHRTV